MNRYQWKDGKLIASPYPAAVQAIRDQNGTLWEAWPMGCWSCGRICEVFLTGGAPTSQPDLEDLAMAVHTREHGVFQ